jgi:hypothetical protein
MSKWFLDSTGLRRLAEMADGGRDEDFYIAVDADRKMVALREPPEPGKYKLVVPVHTSGAVPERRGIRKLTATLDDGRTVEIFPEAGLEVPDAMFWTESSVEKFLVPYYARVHSAASRVGDEVQKVKDVFNGKVRPYGLPSHEPVEVFALVHLPRSEYTATESALLSSLGVLYAVGGGEAVLTPLPEFVDGPGAAGR